MRKTDGALDRAWVCSAPDSLTPGKAHSSEKSLWGGLRMAPASLPGSGLCVSCEDGAARAGEGPGEHRDCLRLTFSCFSSLQHQLQEGFLEQRQREEQSPSSEKARQKA